MQGNYVLELHKTKERHKKPFGSRFKPYKGYFRASGPEKKMRKLEKKMSRKGWKTLLYAKEYSRSSNYRDNILRLMNP